MIEAIKTFIRAYRLTNRGWHYFFNYCPGRLPEHIWRPPTGQFAFGGKDYAAITEAAWIHETITERRYST
jgi:hypothetical protein